MEDDVLGGTINAYVYEIVGKFLIKILMKIKKTIMGKKAGRVFKQHMQSIY